MYFVPALLQTEDYARDTTSGINHGAKPGNVCRKLSSGWSTDLLHHMRARCFVLKKGP